MKIFSKTTHSSSPTTPSPLADIEEKTKLTPEQWRKLFEAARSQNVQKAMSAVEQRAKPQKSFWKSTDEGKALFGLSIASVIGWAITITLQASGHSFLTSLSDVSSGRGDASGFFYMLFLLVGLCTLMLAVVAAMVPEKLKQYKQEQYERRNITHLVEPSRLHYHAKLVPSKNHVGGTVVISCTYPVVKNEKVTTTSSEVARLPIQGQNIESLTTQFEQLLQDMKKMEERVNVAHENLSIEYLMTPGSREILTSKLLAEAGDIVTNNTINEGVYETLNEMAQDFSADQKSEEQDAAFNTAVLD